MDWKRIACPNCHRVYKIEDVLPDELLQCHACEHCFSAPEAQEHDAIFSLASEFETSADVPTVKKTVAANTEQVACIRDKSQVPDVPDVVPVEVQNNQPQVPDVPNVEQDVITQKSDTLAGGQQPTAEPAYAQDVWGDEVEKKFNMQKILSFMKKKQERLFLLLRRKMRYVEMKPWGVGLVVFLALFLVWSAVEDSLLNDPKSRSILMQLNVALPLKYTDWQVSGHLRMEWVESNMGRDLLLVKGKISNRLNVKLPLPFIRIRMYAQYDPERLIQEQILPVKMVNKQNILQMSPDKLPMDLEMMDPLEEREFTLVVENLAYDVGHITMRPTLKRPK